jgi:hypothetical protein
MQRTHMKNMCTSSTVYESVDWIQQAEWALVNTGSTKDENFLTR